MTYKFIYSPSHNPLLLNIIPILHHLATDNQLDFLFYHFIRGYKPLSGSVPFALIVKEDVIETGGTKLLLIRNFRASLLVWADVSTEL